MIKQKIYSSAPLVAKYLKLKSSKKDWQLRWSPVCASTEIDLSKWIDEKPFIVNQPRAFLASRQSNGRGQYGRTWDSPYGGVWLSAAIPFNKKKETTELFGLAVAVALSKRLKRYSIHTHIKWPNDLIVNDRKLAGFLPRVIIRGQMVKFARIGIGLNVVNRVPKGATSLREITGKKNISISLFSAEVLIALENAIKLLEDNSTLCQQAEKLLWSKQITEPESEKVWLIEGFNSNGSLRLKRGQETKSMFRWQ